MSFLFSTGKILGIGIGVGLGIAVLLAAIIGIMVYCRIKGREEGQQVNSKDKSARYQRFVCLLLHIIWIFEPFENKESLISENIKMHKLGDMSLLGFSSLVIDITCLKALKIIVTCISKKGKCSGEHKDITRFSE